MKKRFRLSEGSGKTIIALALVSLLALPLFSLIPRRAELVASGQHSHLRGTELKQRATAICVALGCPNPTVSEPRFAVQTFRYCVPCKERRLWIVECQAGPHHYSMMYNDATGNLESMYSDGLSVSARTSAHRNIVVNSANEAVEGSVRRLKDLQMLPKGTLLTLVDKPLCDRDGITWRLLWKVRPAGTTAPYDVRMILNGSDVTPMTVVNCSELGKALPN